MPSSCSCLPFFRSSNPKKKESVSAWNAEDVQSEKEAVELKEQNGRQNGDSAAQHLSSQVTPLPTTVSAAPNLNPAISKTPVLIRRGSVERVDAEEISVSRSVCADSVVEVSMAVGVVMADRDDDCCEEKEKEKLPSSLTAIAQLMSLQQQKHGLQMRSIQLQLKVTPPPPIPAPIRSTTDDDGTRASTPQPLSVKHMNRSPSSSCVSSSPVFGSPSSALLPTLTLSLVSQSSHTFSSASDESCIRSAECGGGWLRQSLPTGGEFAERVGADAGAWPPTTNEQKMHATRLPALLAMLNGEHHLTKYGHHGLPRLTRIHLSTSSATAPTAITGVSATTGFVSESDTKVDSYRIYWNWKGSVSSKKFITFNEIRSVVAGVKTDVLRRRVDEKKRGHLCFSVFCAHRTLDLEASSQVDRDCWVDGLRAYLDSRRMRGCRWTQRLMYSEARQPHLAASHRRRSQSQSPQPTRASPSPSASPTLEPLAVPVLAVSSSVVTAKPKLMVNLHDCESVGAVKRSLSDDSQPSGSGVVGSSRLSVASSTRTLATTTTPTSVDSPSPQSARPFIPPLPLDSLLSGGSSQKHAFRPVSINGNGNGLHA